MFLLYVMWPNCTKPESWKACWIIVTWGLDCCARFRGALRSLLSGPHTSGIRRLCVMKQVIIAELTWTYLQAHWERGEGGKFSSGPDVWGPHYCSKIQYEVNQNVPFWKAKFENFLPRYAPQECFSQVQLWLSTSLHIFQSFHKITCPNWRLENCCASASLTFCSLGWHS